MDNRRVFLFGLLAVLLAAWGGWRLYSTWGLVTLDVKDAPLRDVLAKIERQGGIDIETNLDPATPVTVQVRLVPPVEALDYVAVRTDSTWRLAYLGAPEAGAIDTVLGAFRAGQPTENWTSHGGGGFSLVEPASGAALDLRNVRWTPGPAADLPAMLDDAAQKTGVLLAAPADWKPAAAAPKAGPVRKAVPELMAKAGGKSREVFLLSGSPNRGQQAQDEMARFRARWIGAAPDRGPAGGGGRGGGPGGGSGGGWGRMMGDPQQMAERAEAQVALLPKAEQAAAREELLAMRNFWESVKDLPEDQRREKAREFFTSPARAERMDERRTAREAKMSPAQRIERAKNYWERKAEAKYRGGAGS